MREAAAAFEWNVARLHAEGTAALAQQAEADEAEYQAATPTGRKAILAAHRKRLMAEARKSLAALATKRAKASGHQKERVAYLMSAKHALAAGKDALKTAKACKATFHVQGP